MFPDTISDVYYETTTAWIAPVCRTCKFWRAEPDGEAGECVSPMFADDVWAKWEPLSPVMMKGEFHCPYWEQNDK